MIRIGRDVDPALHQCRVSCICTDNWGHRERDLLHIGGDGSGGRVGDQRFVGPQREGSAGQL